MGGLVWLASYPKSGNTWARSFLHVLLQSRAEDGRDAVSADINALQGKTTWDSSYGWYKPFLPDKPLQECTLQEIANARMQANQRMADAAGDGLLFVKTHNALMSDHGGIPLINRAVTAGAVYLIRNPLDVAVSYSHHLGLSLDRTIRLMARPGKIVQPSDLMAYELQGSWSEHVSSWTRQLHSALHIVRYEDMQHQALPTFTALVNFLQIEAAPVKISRVLEVCSFDNLKAQEQQHGFKEKPERAQQFFRRGKTGDWRHTLSKRQVREIVAAHGEQMARFDYLPE